MNLQFKTWLMESIVSKSRLVVYDFDGTFANVPEKPAGWKKDKTDPHGTDWWAHPESLSAPAYNGEVHNEVVDAWKKDQADPQTEVILLTGRRGVIANKVRSILRSQGLFGKRVIPNSNASIQKRYQTAIEKGDDVLHPEEHLGHEEYYAGDHITEPDYPQTLSGKIDGTTLAHKIYVIKKKMNSNIVTLEFWDDRVDHAPSFIKCGLDMLKQYGVDHGGKLHTVIFHRIFFTPGAPIHVQHIPIEEGMKY